jgi:predicted ATPase
LAEGFDDGVWLVELAPLSDPDLVPQEVASVLSVSETPGIPLVDSLLAHLRAREVLLVLDNCEHLVAASASLVGTLLRSCPRLSVLATSREALGVEGEIQFAVPPLSLPDLRHLQKVEDLSRYEAAGLFVEKVAAARPDFALTGDNFMAVTQICSRLDGIPLALELAAARARVLSPWSRSPRASRALSACSPAVIGPRYPTTGRSGRRWTGARSC